MRDARMRSAKLGCEARMRSAKLGSKREDRMRSVKLSCEARCYDAKRDVNRILASHQSIALRILASRSASSRYLMHIDGYDKLKPFNLAIHGTIDGYVGLTLGVLPFKTYTYLNIL